MADPGHDNDYHDLGSFDDESSVISVSATFPQSFCWTAHLRWQLRVAHEQSRDGTNRRRNNDRPEGSKHSAAKSPPPPRT